MTTLWTGKRGGENILNESLWTTNVFGEPAAESNQHLGFALQHKASLHRLIEKHEHDNPRTGAALVN
jgi:hypothetical protein